MKETYYHEDDYCQTELVPHENETFVREEIAAITNFADTHRAENGIGWTDMYMRHEPSVKLEDYKMSYRDFCRELSQTATQFDKVYTGYSSYREECKNTAAFGSDRVRVFVSNKNGIVNAIWFDFFLGTKSDAEELYSILEIVAAKHDLLFVDWPGEFYSRVKTDAELKIKLLEIASMRATLPAVQKTQKKWWQFWK